jgi:CheY-like chemotaxis protein
MTMQIRLLVVDDEPIIRLSIQDALESGGYEVRTAANGADAIALLDDPAFAVAGLVTDIKLGDGPNGWDVARHARDRNAGISIVYVTGDSVGQWPVEGVPKSIVLQKPFADAQLLTAISTLLNDQAGTLPAAG